MYRLFDLGAPGWMTRELPKVGLRLSILIPARWNEHAFAGVCLANGCPVEFAWLIAAELGREKVRLVTVRPQLERELFVAACRTLGVRVEEIPPL